MMLKGSTFPRPRLLAAAATAALLAACVVAPPPRDLAPPPPPPNVTVYAYPQQGQSHQQLDRDRYECSTWATQQTGFNPSAPNVPPHERVQVVAGAPPAAVWRWVPSPAVSWVLPFSSPRNAGAGLLLGALLGGAVGAGAEASADANAQAAVDANANARTQAQAAQIERKASDYRRALGACLEGRATASNKGIQKMTRSHTTVRTAVLTALGLAAALVCAQASADSRFDGRGARARAARGAASAHGRALLA